MTHQAVKDLEAVLQALHEECLPLPLFAPATTNPQPHISAPSPWHTLTQHLKTCQECSLYLGRTKPALGAGNTSAKVMFVGDYPSDQDDSSGSAFSDSIGDVLKRMIVAMKLAPESVYLANLVTCRPPSGSSPSEEEILICRKHLDAQIDLIQPTIIIALGEQASRSLTRSDTSLRLLRPQNFAYGRSKLFCTHHPRNLLDTPENKSSRTESWNDLKRIMQEMGVKT